jgi:hypothetical protein|tara:strand:- start:45 stop:242 length:198 start_codon:yes stop_codon:yes gene_type:complete
MIPVQGHKHLYRDENSGAIVNNDSQGYSQYIAMRDRRKNEENELKKLRSDIDEIKSLLKEVLNKT